MSSASCEVAAERYARSRARRTWQGLEVLAGDELVIPAGWLKFSFTLEGQRQLTCHGVAWFAELANVDGLSGQKRRHASPDRAAHGNNLSVLAALADIWGPQSDDDSHLDKVVAILDSARVRCVMVLSIADIPRRLQNAIRDNDVATSIWAMACAGRCRSMLVFKEHLEEVVLMGQSAKRIVDILRTWQANQETQQRSISANARLRRGNYALSQVFAASPDLHSGPGVRGRHEVDRSSAKFADFLFAHDASREAVLVEIKTPVTAYSWDASIEAPYRPATELTGAVAQVLDYRRLTCERAALPAARVSVARSMHSFQSA